MLFKLLACLAIAWSVHAQVRIGIVSDHTYYGEREIGWRIKRAAEHLGWEAILDENQGVQVKKRTDLDWVICLLPQNIHHNPHCPNYLTIFHPFGFLDQDKKLLSFYEKYDGYLMTIEPVQEFEAESGRKLNWLPFYPSIQLVPYKQIPLTHLVTTLPAWSRRRFDKKYQTLYSLLSQSGKARFYGMRMPGNGVKRGYLGKIPFDGISVIDALQKHGIVLVLHSHTHNREGIPSSRIFEAAAASALIISDENEFVRKQFGDSVFYIDINLSAEEIYRQIQTHLDFIQYHPEICWEMAKTAHRIFEEKFILSQQLLKIDEMNQQIKNEREFGR